MNIKDIALHHKYVYTKTNVIVEVLKIDRETKNVYIRSSKLLDGWYAQDGWVHVNNISKLGD